MNGPFKAVRPLILASSSPRRQDFFREQGLSVAILAPTMPEEAPCPGEAPVAYALRTATAKAREALTIWQESRQDTDKENNTAATASSNPVVIAADTIVVLENKNHGARILGKPADSHDALAMLEALSGQKHEVITACCLLSPHQPPVQFADSAHVHFAAWPHEVLAAYAATGEPADKAGSYAIQGMGAFLVERVEGSWSTVVGLPLSMVIRHLLDMKAICARSA